MLAGHLNLFNLVGWQFSKQRKRIASGDGPNCLSPRETYFNSFAQRNLNYSLFIIHYSLFFPLAIKKPKSVIITAVNDTGEFYRKNANKKKPKMRNCLVAITLLFSCINTSFALNGLGTGASPWLIQSITDFDQFTANSAYWSGHIRLDTNLDLTGKTYTKAPIAPHISDPDWPFEGTAFTGIFEGNGHTISNLTISNGTYYLGLFGKIDNGSVTNLGLENVGISGAGRYVGSLCGLNDGSIADCYSTGIVNGSVCVGGLCGYHWDGAITNCYSTGTVNGDCYTGGLCGEKLYGNFTNCYFTGTVNSGGYVGGLCGGNYNGSIANCYSTGTVTGTDYVGGLCGEHWGGSITSCHSSSTVTGDTSVGGLCGRSDGSVTDCYSTGTINGMATGDSSSVGGLCGSNYGTITSCYSTGSFVGTGRYMGGLCGDNNGPITSCYSTGSFNGTDNVGGLIGYNNAVPVNNSFWDMDTSGWLTSDGGTGKTTTQMQDINTFLAANWNFQNIWHMPYQSTGYPMLFFQRDIPGDFTAGYGVTLTDFAIFSQSWLTSSGQPDYNDDCDLVDDDTINIADLTVLAENFLQGL